MSNIYRKLAAIQNEYYSNKTQRNTYGNFDYRSIEGMIKGLKPLLQREGLTLTFNEEMVGDFMKCTCALTDIETGEKIENSSISCPDLTKKGMDTPQQIGCAITYGRRYVLMGLLAVTDDNDDPDNSKNSNNKRAEEIRMMIQNSTDKPTIMQVYNSLTDTERTTFKSYFTKRKKELGIK